MAEPVGCAGNPGEVAERWRYLDGRGEFGLISSVSAPFCSTCTRARLTAVGELYTCLFAAHGRDLRGLLRGGVDDDALHTAIAAAWGARDDRYSELHLALGENAVILASEVVGYRLHGSILQESPL